MTQVKERPILFSGPMVRAILGGRKTQTRRVIKFTEFGESDTPGYRWHFRGTRRGGTGGLWQDMRQEQVLDLCPYGEPGDRLWVRETCRAEELPCGLDGVRYAADNAFIEIENTQAASDRWADLFYYGKSKGKGVPSIHMPRWASRITLEITGVRVERLNEISEADAIAEGVDPGCLECGENCIYTGGCGQCSPCYRHSFAGLWKLINGPSSWSANPWVWVVEFRMVGP